MSNEIVAGIAGVVIGHILWLVGMSLATEAVNVSVWVLVVAAVSVLGGAAAVYLGRRLYRERSRVWGILLCCLPVSPVIFSLVVLGVTYL